MSGDLNVLEIGFGFLLLSIALIGAALVIRLLGWDRRAGEPGVDVRGD